MFFLSKESWADLDLKKKKNKQLTTNFKNKLDIQNNSNLTICTRKKMVQKTEDPIEILEPESLKSKSESMSINEDKNNR